MNHERNSIHPAGQTIQPKRNFSVTKTEPARLVEHHKNAPLRQWPFAEVDF